MHRKLPLTCVLLILMPGCDWPLFTTIQRLEQVHGPSPPVIYEAYAPSFARPGEAWRIYLKAGDPDGDIKALVATMEQGGTAVGSSAVAVGAANRKNLNGYISVILEGPAGLTDLRGSVKVEDMANHFSNEVFFPLSLQAQGIVPYPTLNLFSEENLGSVTIAVHAAPGKKPSLWARFVARVKKIF